MNLLSSRHLDFRVSEQCLQLRVGNEADSLWLDCPLPREEVSHHLNGY
jgi:hypothetical protein